MRAAISSAHRGKAATLNPEDAAKLHEVLEGIAKISSPWAAFERLQELGPTTFRDTIRELLRPAASGRVPRSYLSIWDLRVAGVLNLNLDRLATRAYSEKYPGHALSEFSGIGIASHLHVLKGPHSFVVNLHGDVDDIDSWIFTQAQLARLRADQSYQTFIRTCIAGHTVLFLGIGADDVAVGGHLTMLSELKIDFGTHYWLTDRRDAETDKWAERAGIRVIRYTSRGSDHSDVDGFFADLLQFVPPEDVPAPPVAFTTSALPAVELPPPAELVLQDAETIRVALNRRAAELLEKSPDNYDEYLRFLEEYDECVHRAWYTSTAPGRNDLLGFKLESEIARGAFGRVYRARTAEGSDVAIKVLLGEVRTQQGFLPSFRRGVRSMEILSRHGVRGMVAYRQASEIPALVVMDLVEGPNLKEAVEARQVEQWHVILRVARALTGILRAAHGLPERVLHRDLRPANVMLRSFWTDPDDWDVVVLDFDLSWHRGAFEQSVLHSSGIAGYLAPEQIQPRRGISTRHAAVDCFGLGMTLYYLVSRVDPIPDQHRHRDWQTVVYGAVRDRSATDWRSLPMRFGRLILCATQDAQSQRWDMAQIDGELARLSEAHLSPRSVTAPDLLAEEIAARCAAVDRYEWDDDKLLAHHSLPSGVEVGIRADVSGNEILIYLDWRDRGAGEWRRVARWLPDAVSAATSALGRGGWQEVESDQGAGTMQVHGRIDSHDAAARIDDLASGLSTAIDAMRFQ